MENHLRRHSQEFSGFPLTDALPKTEHRPPSAPLQPIYQSPAPRMGHVNAVGPSAATPSVWAQSLDSTVVTARVLLVKIAEACLGE